MMVEQKLDREVAALLRSSAKKASSGQRRNVTYSSLLSDRVSMIKIIGEGVPYSLFSLIQTLAPFSEADWAKLLDLSTKSLHRYKQTSKRFRPLQSEKIIEMAEVTNIGTGVFGNVERFKDWLDTPNIALGNVRPIELLKDSYGKEMIVDELTRIEHGIFV